MSGDFERVSRDVWADYEAAVERTDAALAEFLAAHRPAGDDAAEVA